MQRLFVIQAYLDRAQQIPRIWVFICPNPSIFTGMHGATNYASELQLLVGNLRTKFHEKISFRFYKTFFPRLCDSLFVFTCRPGSFKPRLAVIQSKLPNSIACIPKKAVVK